MQAFNALSAITFNNLVHGADIPLTLHRSLAPLDLIKPRIAKSRGPPPDRLPAILPPPGNLHLQLSLGGKVGNGRVGLVHDISPLSLLDPSTDSSTAPGLPPLVVKIARRDGVAYMAREAWFYDEMESLQGICIPRCYGWFEATLPSEVHCVTAWEGVPPDPDRLKWPDGLLKELSEARNRVSVLLLEKMGDHLPIGEALPDDIK